MYCSEPTSCDSAGSTSRADYPVSECSAGRIPIDRLLHSLDDARAPADGDDERRQNEREDGGRRPAAHSAPRWPAQIRFPDRARLRPGASYSVVCGAVSRPRGRSRASRAIASITSTNSIERLLALGLRRLDHHAPLRRRAGSRSSAGGCRSRAGAWRCRACARRARLLAAAGETNSCMQRRSYGEVVGVAAGAARR